MSDASERRFRLTSAAVPVRAVEPQALCLIVYTVTLSGEILLNVRCYGGYPPADAEIAVRRREPARAGRDSARGQVGVRLRRLQELWRR
jgi:hypothetical protein